jgi:hypothetical protein
VKSKVLFFSATCHSACFSGASEAFFTNLLCRIGFFFYFLKFGIFGFTWDRAKEGATLDPFAGLSAKAPPQTLAALQIQSPYPSKIRLLVMHSFDFCDEAPNHEKHCRLQSAREIVLSTHQSVGQGTRHGV